MQATSCEVKTHRQCQGLCPRQTSHPTSFLYGASGTTTARPQPQFFPNTHRAQVRVQRAMCHVSKDRNTEVKRKNCQISYVASFYPDKQNFIKAWEARFQLVSDFLGFREGAGIGLSSYTPPSCMLRALACEHLSPYVLALSNLPNKQPPLLSSA